MTTSPKTAPILIWQFSDRPTDDWMRKKRFTQEQIPAALARLLKMATIDAATGEIGELETLVESLEVDGPAPEVETADPEPLWGDQ